jgi:hypothetical protein
VHGSASLKDYYAVAFDVIDPSFKKLDICNGYYGSLGG